MKIRKFTLIPFLLLALGFQRLPSFAEEELPHAYPRIGVRTLFENERVYAWDVTWLPGISQPYHRHQYDLAAVYLRYGPIRITTLDGTENPQTPPFDIPRPFFQPAGVTHKEEMVRFPEDTPTRWAIMFDLKEVLGRRVDVIRGTEAAFPRSGAELAIDNERVLEWVHDWQEGEAGMLMTYERDALQVFSEPGILEYTFVSGVTLTEAYAVGDTRFIAAGTVRAEKAVMGSPQAVTIELK
ncbi:MAG: hypothetical protein CMQ14_01280 [Gammaproteobacteria bacterium]|nr:hypothetical protein [Gammaproteobacteria bacterium]